MIIFSFGILISLSQPPPSKNVKDGLEQTINSLQGGSQ